jgi:hypothetical protein
MREGGPDWGVLACAVFAAAVPVQKPQPTSLKSLMQAEAKERALEVRITYFDAAKEEESGMAE